jgi:hypothetical protein
MIASPRAAVVASGFMGDTIACTAAASSLHDRGFDVTLFTRWPQIQSLLENDPCFDTVVYGRVIPRRIQRPLLPRRFELIVREPYPWSYQEPFTSEIRRLSGSSPTPGYTLHLNERQKAIGRLRTDRPSVAISRDLRKRAFGRDVEALLAMIEEIADIRWVGLDPVLHSKHGRRRSIERDASIIRDSTIFFGPEGGMLWIAAGVGSRCVYLTENIARLEDEHPLVWRSLGSCNHFPDARHHALPPGCSNLHAIEEIDRILHEETSRLDTSDR